MKTPTSLMMKTLNSADESFELTFKTMMNKDKTDLICWQRGEDGKPKICRASFSTVDEQHFFVNLFSKDDCAKIKGGVIFFLEMTEKFLFKGDLIELKEKTIQCLRPFELKVLEECDEEAIKGMLGDDFSFEQSALEAATESDSAFNDHLEVDSADKKKKRDLKSEGHLIQQGAGTERVNQGLMVQKMNGGGADKISTHMSSKFKGQSARDAEIFNTELSFITLDAEEKIYEGLRESVRSKAPEGKMVGVQITGQENSKKDFQLYDLSRGGFAVLTFSGQDFELNQEIELVGFNEQKLDTPMKGLVRSIREADEMGIQFKVGFQFTEEEEEASTDTEAA